MHASENTYTTDMLPKEDQERCAAIFARYIHFAAFASDKQTRLSGALDKLQAFSDHSTHMDDTELKGLIRGLNTFSDILAVLTNNCINDIEGYFKARYYLQFNGFATTPGMMMTSYTPVIENMLKQIGADLYDCGRQRLYNDFRSLCRRLNPERRKKRVVMNDIFKCGEFSHLKPTPETPDLKILLHAVALFTQQVLYLPADFGFVLNRWEKHIELFAQSICLSGSVEFITGEGSIGVKFHRQEDVLAFWECYNLDHL